MRRFAFGLLLCAGVAASGPAWALTPEEEATAIGLMKEGIAARDRGDLGAAEQAFSRAHALAGLPSSGIALAKVLVARGRLSEALQLVLAIQRMPPDPTWTEASTDGYREAIAMGPELEARIPTLLLEVPGAPESSLRITVDGGLWKAPVLGVPRKLDPGRHTIEVHREGFEPATVDVTLAERARERVPIILHARRERPRSSPAPVEEPGHPALIAGLVTGGLGLAAIAGGFVTGAMSESKESELAPQCPDGVCPPSLGEQLGDAETLSTTANVLFVVGGTLAAAGVTLVVIDLSAGEEPSGPATAVRIGPGFATLDVRF